MRMTSLSRGLTLLTLTMLALILLTGGTHARPQENGNVLGRFSSVRNFFRCVMRNFQRNFGGGRDVSDEDDSGMNPDTPDVPGEDSNERNPETPVDVPDERTTEIPADIPEDEVTATDTDLFNVTEGLGTNEKLQVIAGVRECWRRRDEN